MKKIFYFLLLGLVLNSCSTKKDTDYKTAAEDHLQKGNVPEAITAYEDLMKEFPESKLAPEAQYKIATIYQNKLVKNLSDKESLRKAAETFKLVYEKYPESKEAPMALFMSAFIQANELKQFDEATKTYNLFLAKYPNHELTSSAREELENMGLSPEEILRKKEAAGS